MLRIQAERAAKQMIMSGYRHHTYEEELRTRYALFRLERDEFVKILDSPNTDRSLLNYREIMGPTSLRALKNSLICLIAATCRIAIELGMEVELSFALSDYYINHLETITDEASLLALSKQILLHYFDLVQNASRQQYSKPIAGAMRYIGRNLYGVCRVSSVAAYVGLEVHYFSKLFAKQVGMCPSKYIMQRKLEEGKHQLSELGAHVTDIAESLGFCDAAHFSRCFKKQYGIAPSRMENQEIGKTAKEVRVG
ncbi:MAG: helix-turn-helix domain-containing protein [Clostridiales Family XIII bacterium]|nr:helix-turn-helix domain-containing protein [Clostridiales Family XIII bacterium]